MFAHWGDTETTPSTMQQPFVTNVYAHLKRPHQDDQGGYTKRFDDGHSTHHLMPSPYMQPAQAQWPAPMYMQQWVDPSHHMAAPVNYSMLMVPGTSPLMALEAMQDKPSIFPHPLPQPNQFRGDTTPCPRDSVPDNHQYESIAARLELFSKGRQIKITVGELRRRTRLPEAAGVLELTALLKKPKSHANGQVKSFFNAGVDTAKRPDDHIPRKNVFVGLAEEEAQVLVRDFHRLTKDGLQCSLLASHVLSTEFHDAKQREELRKNMPGIKKLIKEAGALISAIGLKAADMDRNMSREATDEYVKHFSLLTHGFGPSATVTALNTVKDVIEEIEKHLGPPSSPPPSDSSYLNDSGIGMSPPSSSFTSSSDLDSPPSVGTHKFGSGAGRSCAAEGSPLVLAQTGDQEVYDATVLARLIPDQRIPVTVGEVRRRVCGPEAMHASLLCAYLRKAKKTGRYTDIRNELQKYNIDMKANGKKGMETTSWTSLTETEAVQIAEMTRNELYKVPCNTAIINQVRADLTQHGSGLGVVGLIKLVLTTMVQALLAVGVDPQQPSVTSHIEEHIHRFAMMTHHFGHAFIGYVAHWLYLVTEQAKQYC